VMGFWWGRVTIHLHFDVGLYEYGFAFWRHGFDHQIDIRECLSHHFGFRLTSKPPAFGYACTVQVPRCLDATGIRSRAALGKKLFIRKGYGRDSRICLDCGWKLEEVSIAGHAISSS
jgi:hypothetical protein